MNLPAASSTVSKQLRFYPLSSTFSPGRGDLQGPCRKLQVIIKSKSKRKEDTMSKSLKLTVFVLVILAIALMIVFLVLPRMPSVL
jgi:lipopolysaccharide/colanic/teichoic acid biosynthesis glycosyltransferase